MNEERVEQLEADMFNFIQSMRLLSKENSQLAHKLERVQEENKWLSAIVAVHERGLTDLEDSILI